MNDLDDFFRFLRLQNKSEGTIKQYKSALSRIPEDPLDRDDYLVINRKNHMIMAAWRSYLKFQRTKGKISAESLLNQLETYQLPKKRGKTKKGKAYPFDQWSELVKNAPHKQAKMGIWLGLQFGLRLQEITNLRVQDVDLENRLIKIRIQDEWNPKHFRERDIPLNDQQYDTIKKWIEERPANLQTPYIIWSPHGNAGSGPISDKTFQLWCKSANPNLKPHDLRRSYATNLYYKSGKDLKVVQLALGHSNVAITSDYLRLDQTEYMEKIREAMSKE